MRGNPQELTWSHSQMMISAPWFLQIFIFPCPLIKAFNSSTSPKLVDEMSPGQPVSCLVDPLVDQPIAAREAAAWANPQARDTRFRPASVGLEVLPSLITLSPQLTELCRSSTPFPPSLHMSSGWSNHLLKKRQHASSFRYQHGIRIYTVFPAW